MRCSPPVRMNRSGGGAPASWVCAAKDASSICSTASVPSATRRARRRAASTMSQRPPYDTATKKVMRLFCAVRASAAAIRSARAGRSRPTSPMKRTRIPLRCSSSTSLSMASTKSSMSLVTSSSGRCQFSLEKANTVSASTPRRAQPSTHARTALAPARWPKWRGNARRLAQRPLPSMITATWRGSPGCATGSDLQQFFFLLVHHGIDVRDVLVRELLHFLVRLALDVLGDHLLLEHLLEVLQHVTAHVADRDARVLGFVLDHLGEVLAAL